MGKIQNYLYIVVYKEGDFKIFNGMPPAELSQIVARIFNVPRETTVQQIANWQDNGFPVNEWFRPVI